jgi:large-conductance mechanosensitive channel
MLKHYTKELITVAIAFSLISWSIYVCAEPVKAKTVTVTAKKATVKPEVKKEHKKKPTLKKKYADKK